MNLFLQMPQTVTLFYSLKATGIRIGTVVTTITMAVACATYAFVHDWRMTLLVLAFTPFFVISGAIQTKVFIGKGGDDDDEQLETGKVSSAYCRADNSFFVFCFFVLCCVLLCFVVLCCVLFYVVLCWVVCVGFCFYGVVRYLVLCCVLLGFIVWCGILYYVVSCRVVLCFIQCVMLCWVLLCGVV